MNPIQYKDLLQRCLRIIICACVFGWFSSANLVASEPDFTVTSSFSSVESTVGNRVAYTIQIRKHPDANISHLASVQQPELPPTAGIDFGRFQLREQYLSSEGEDPVGIILEFEAVPKIEGRILVPSFSMRYMGRTLRVPAAVIRVRARDEIKGSGELEWAILQLGDLPATMHLGERYRTSLSLYIFRGVRNLAYGNPEQVGSDFSLDRIVPGPTERVVNRGAFRYQAYSWPLTFTPVRTGKIAVGFRQNVTFRLPNDRLGFIRAMRQGEDVSEQVLASLFLDSQEDVFTVFTPTRNVVVESLGTERPPENFYNAIGQFEMELTLDSTHLEVGRPALLTFTLSGEGNHGAQRPPNLRLGNRWRVFAPQESFEDLDLLAFRGIRRYQYSVIPLSLELEAVPSIDYVVFDTASGAFKTLTSKPLPVTVTGDSITQIELDSDVRGQAATQRRVVHTPHDSVLWVLGRRDRLGVPFFYQTWFIVSQITLALAVAGLFFMRWTKNREERDPSFARKRQVAIWKKRYLKLASLAAKEEDSELFYESAFLVFAALVSQHHNRNAEAVTVEEVLETILTLDLNENARRTVDYYLNRYEHQRFSGEREPDPPLAQEYLRLRSILRQVENQLNNGTPVKELQT